MTLPDEDAKLDAGTLDAEFLARLSELNAQFAAALPQTLNRLLEAHNDFDPEQPSQTLIDGLHVTLHSLAGSSATFGFSGLGRSARALEDRLLSLAESAAAAPADWRNWLADLHGFAERAGRDPHGL